MSDNRGVVYKGGLNSQRRGERCANPRAFGSGLAPDVDKRGESCTLLNILANR